MAAFCMAHFEGVVDTQTKPTLEQVRYRGPERLSDRRLKYLRLFDRWVVCLCRCGRKWNFVSDPPDALADNGMKQVGINCQAEGMSRERPLKEAIFVRGYVGQLVLPVV